MSDKKLICPLMSCRTTSMTEPPKEGQIPVTTPTVVKCQEADCALWGQYDRCSLKKG